MAEPSSCVDDEALFRLARGKLVGAELAEVEAHLQGCSDCRAVLAEAARSLEVRGEGEASSSASGPTQIARYQIVSLIGAGAAGVVYRAFDPQLKRTVALKVLRPELHGAAPAQSERMLREAQSMARLSDPHVVALYDVGLHEGTVYLVMEYIDGSTLTEWLRAEPRSVTEILRVLCDAGRGLAAAHHKGLVHRDFKPENVLVARDGRARVTDFGLARESENWLLARAVDDQTSTELYAPTRGLVGTPAYMAPELFEGGLATSASDQFALCVALYVALFDKHPFKAGEGIALSELVTRVRSGTVQKPALQNDEQQRLFEVLGRGLLAEPQARFADLPTLLAAVERAAQGSRRRGLLWALGAALLLLALAAAVRWGAPAASSGSVAVAPAASAPAASLAAASSSSAAPAALAGSAAKPGTALTASRPPGAAASAQRRASPQKPGDVRYKDWLKDPF